MCTMDLQCSEINPLYCTTEFHTIFKLLPTDKVWMLSVHKGIYKRNNNHLNHISIHMSPSISNKLSMMFPEHTSQQPKKLHI